MLLESPVADVFCPASIMLSYARGWFCPPDAHQNSIFGFLCGGSTSDGDSTTVSVQQPALEIANIGPVLSPTSGQVCPRFDYAGCSRDLWRSSLWTQAACFCSVLLLLFFLRSRQRRRHNSPFLPVSPTGSDSPRLQKGEVRARSVLRGASEVPLLEASSKVPEGALAVTTSPALVPPATVVAPSAVMTLATQLQVDFLHASPICDGASSERLPQLNVQAEYAAITDALRHVGPSGGTRPSIRVATVEAISRMTAVARHTPEQCSWWHICAHSDAASGRLILEDEDGCAHPVAMTAQLFGGGRSGGSPPELLQSRSQPQAQALRGQVSAAPRNNSGLNNGMPLGALVLACGSEPIGHALLECGTKFALVSLGPMLDDAARLFTVHFYRVLLALWPRAPLAGAFPSAHLEARVRSAVLAAVDAGRASLKAAARADIRAEEHKLRLLEASPAAGQRPCQPRGPSNVGCSPARNPVSGNAEGDGANHGGAFNERDSGASAPHLNHLSQNPFQAANAALHQHGRPEECEDFVGRAPEFRVLARILGSQGRRLMILHGPAGIGKSAICAEFCRFMSTPGRRFSAWRGASAGGTAGLTAQELTAGEGAQRVQRLTFVSLRSVSLGALEGGTNSTMTTHGGSLAQAARCALWRAARAMLEGAPSDGARQAPSLALAPGPEDPCRACLVIDDAEVCYGWQDAIAEELLASYPSLSLLLVRRRPLYRLPGCDRWKPVNLEVPPLPIINLCKLFMRRVHRPLTEADFQGPGAEGEPLRLSEALMRRVAEHPAIVACRGMPSRAVQLAAAVTPQLPSMLLLVDCARARTNISLDEGGSCGITGVGDAGGSRKFSTSTSTIAPSADNAMGCLEAQANAAVVEMVDAV